MYMLSANTLIASATPVQYKGERASPLAKRSAAPSLARRIRQKTKAKNAAAMIQPVITLLVSGTPAELAQNCCRAFTSIGAIRSNP
jgi:hypothetical protein